MKIYTKRGDTGQTDLLTARVNKTDLAISVNGAIDETMAVVLMAKQFITDNVITAELNTIHGYLFSIAHEIALNDPQKPIITHDQVQWIEQRIDHYEGMMEPLQKFIRLDESLAAAWLNMARVTVRRAEREMVLLLSHKELNPETLALMNRFSDYFFVLGRFHNNP